MSITKIVARAWHDAAYKAKLLRDPHATLAEAGVEVPAGTRMKIVENDADTHHLVLPVAPPNSGALTRLELEKVASAMLMRGNVM